MCFLLLYFDYDMIGRRDFFFRACMPCFFLYFSTHASLLAFFVVSLSYFVLAVPMRECLGKHSCMSSPFPIAIQNGTCFFPTVQLQVHNVYSQKKTRNSCKPMPLTPLTSRFFCTVLPRAGVKHLTDER